MSSPWGTPPGKMPPINFGGFKGGLPPNFITGGVAVLVLLVVLFSTYFTIDQRERGVILHWGAIAGEAEPGLHFKMPVITTIEKISVQVQKEGFEKTADSDTRLQPYSRDKHPPTTAMRGTY